MWRTDIVMVNVMKRLPAIEKSISNIDSAKDVRIRIVGTVIDVADNALMIDDGSGKVKVSFDSSTNYLKEGQLIRIITRILPLVNGFECRGEAIQNLDNFDINLYKDAKKIISR